MVDEGVRVLGVAAEGAHVAVERDIDVVDVVIDQEHVVSVERQAALSAEKLSGARHVLLLPLPTAFTYDDAKA